MYDQSSSRIRCEWGEHGLQALAPGSDVIIIVDVLSFSTSVELAVSQGAVVFPYRWQDDAVYDFAREVQAEVANKSNPHGFGLSPGTLVSLPPGYRMVLPSPNGSHLTMLAGDKAVIAGCLRNRKAVAAAAGASGEVISVIPAGERWPDGSLRPCFEDLVGAGAIVQELSGDKSPEALAAEACFNRCGDRLYELIAAAASGQEKLAKDQQADVELASALDVSDCVPWFSDGAYTAK